MAQRFVDLNTDCGYLQRGGSYKYPQNMYRANMRTIMFTLVVNPNFTIQKWGSREL